MKVNDYCQYKSRQILCLRGLMRHAFAPKLGCLLGVLFCILMKIYSKCLRRFKLSFMMGLTVFDGLTLQAHLLRCVYKQLWCLVKMQVRKSEHRHPVTYDEWMYNLNEHYTLLMMSTQLWNHIYIYSVLPSCLVCVSRSVSWFFCWSWKRNGGKQWVCSSRTILTADL